MKKWWIAALLLASGPLAAEERLIALVDGSQIRAEILSMQDNRYTLRSAALGTFSLDGSQIRGMSDINAAESMPGPVTPTGGQDGAVAAMRSSIVNNPSLMGQILRLQNDPAMQAILSDPDIMRAVQNFDLDALANNPKIKLLMNNPAVRDIQSGVQ